MIELVLGTFTLRNLNNWTKVDETKLQEVEMITFQNLNNYLLSITSKSYRAKSAKQQILKFRNGKSEFKLNWRN